MTLQDEIRAQLTGPGGPFELVPEDVLGQRLLVFKERPRSLREMLAHSALHGDKDYIVQGTRRISYARHAQLVASVARALQEQHGVGPGDRVALLAANSAEWVITFWATVSLGGIVAAMNGHWTQDEVEYAVYHSQPRLLIGDRRRLERLRGLQLPVPLLEIEAQFPTLEDFDPKATLPDVPLCEDDPCLILYTSGTTGRAKGAVVSHRAIVGFVKTQTAAAVERLMLAARSGALPQGLPPAPPTCSLVTAPLFHLSGLYSGAVMMLAQGARTVYRSGRFDPEDVLRLIEAEQVTIWSALGSAGPQVLAHPALERYDLSSVRNIGFGGAPTSPALQERMRRGFPNARSNIGIGYGLSESGGLGATIGGAELEERPTSTGRAALGHEIEIRDPDGKPLPPGVNGEIFLRSPYLMLEYWRDAEASAKTLRPGRWLATGDIGRVDRDGYLYIDSRARDMILRSGENIYPIEIEHRLDAHPDVAESAVVGVEHEDLGQEVKAFVVPRSGRTLTAESLRAWTGETLAAYKVPSLWELRSEPLPRNAAGKVLKKVLTGEAEPQQLPAEG